MRETYGTIISKQQLDKGLSPDLGLSRHVKNVLARGAIFAKHFQR